MTALAAPARVRLRLAARWSWAGLILRVVVFPSLVVTG